MGIKVKDSDGNEVMDPAVRMRALMEMSCEITKDMPEELLMCFINGTIDYYAAENGHTMAYAEGVMTHAMELMKAMHADRNYNFKDGSYDQDRK